MLAFCLFFPLALTARLQPWRSSGADGQNCARFHRFRRERRVHLADYRGKVVLLNFWGTWCEPCVVELPSLLQLHHDEPNLVILAVSIDEDPDEYAQFIARRHVDLITVRDPGQTAATLFHTDMWPETYVIDRKGVIRSKYVGPQDW